MNLARHAAVLWRFRSVAAGGLAVGILLALLASYKVGFDGGPSLSPRGSETWTATSSILVTQPGFPEGRVTLPEETVAGAVTAEGQTVQDSEPKDQVTFADPARLSGLADLYARFLTSDDVLTRVPGRPAADRITASPFLASSGGVVLPVIQLTAEAPTDEGAKALNQQIYRSLSSLIEEQQDKNDIGPGQRIEVKLIDAPESALTSPRKKTAAILVLFMCLLGTVAVCHLLEGLRPRVEEPVDELVDWDVPLREPVEPVDLDDERDAEADDPRAFEVSGRRRR
jgi:hypothetical protein